MIIAQIYLSGLEEIDGRAEKVETKEFISVKSLKKHLIELQKQYCEKGDKIVTIDKSKKENSLNTIVVYNRECDFNYFANYREWSKK